MDLLDKVELMHTLDQLSDDQYATLISQVFSQDRTTTNQLLSGYFATTNDVALATKIKKIAESIPPPQVSAEEPMAQIVMTDAHVLSHIALFLRFCQIARLELVCRRSFISLRKYPAIHTLYYSELERCLAYGGNKPIARKMDRLKNVRYLHISGRDLGRLSDNGSHPIFKKVQTLKCYRVLDDVSKLISLCDMTEVKSLSITADEEGLTSSQVEDLMELIFSSRNIRTLSLNLIDFASAESIWTVKEIRKKLTELRVLELNKCTQNEIVDTLFEALAPQIHSFNLCEREPEYVDETSVMLSALLQRNSDLKNLKELCWHICDGKDLADGVKGLLGSHIDSLHRIS